MSRSLAGGALRRRMPARRWVLALLAVLGALPVLYFKLLPLAWHWSAMHWQDARDPQGLGLSGYRVVIEGQAVQGLTRNLSGLTYSPVTDSLFSVINRPAQLAELSTDGQLLRLWPLEGVDDPEGITHVRDDLFVVASESSSRLHWLRLGRDTAPVAHMAASEPTLAPARLDNFGVEGVAWDARRGRLFLAEEKWPSRVLVIDDACGCDADLQAPPQVQPWQPQGPWGMPLSDLSSLAIHDDSGQLLLLSDEAAMVAEYTPGGRLVGLMPLWPGRHGLQRKVPQAEGIALGEGGELFVVSEPNLFYRFEKPRI